MRRFFLPLLVCALWLASLAGAGWVRAECVRACARAATAQVEAGDERPCCAKHAAPGKHGAQRAVNGGCSPADCSKCQVLAKALLAVVPAPDAPLFFDTVCGRVEPVALAGAVPCASPSRQWRWSLPPPDTLLSLRCQLII